MIVYPEEEAMEPSKSPLFKDLISVFLVGLFFVGLALLFKCDVVRGFLFNIHEIRKVLQGSGLPGGKTVSAVIFVLAGGLLITMGMPRLWISAIAGAIYGAVLGILLALGAAMLGTAGVYYIGQGFLSGVVHRRMGDRLHVWKKRFQENVFWWVLIGRLFPFSNSTVMSLLCGCCKVPFGLYLVGSFLGYIPLTVVFSVFGSGGVKGNLFQIVLGFAFIGLTFLLRKLLKRIKGSPQSGKLFLSSFFM